MKDLEAVANYFGIKVEDITEEIPSYHDEFVIFNKEIEIVTKETAIHNSLSRHDESVSKLIDSITEKTIDTYTKINKNIYFRWL